MGPMGESLPVITVPAKAFDVQAQDIWQAAEPESLGGSLLLLAIAAVIKLRLRQLLDGHEAGEAVGNVAVRLLLLDVVDIFVIFLGNVQ